MPAKYRQTITVTLTSGTDDPLGDLYDALGTVDFEYIVDDEGDIEELPGLDRDRLVALAVWAAGEDAKRRLGLPSEWYQGDWLRRSDRAGNACGTACCIAGKVALEDGGVPAFRRYSALRNAFVTVPWDQLSPGASADYVLFPGEDEPVEPAVYAKKTLGLTDGQAGRLFDGNNELNDIIRIVGELLKQDEKDESTSRTSRQLRPGLVGACSIGEKCNMCYEDVPVNGNSNPPL